MHVIAPKLWFGNSKLACFVNNQEVEGHKWTVLSKIECTDKVLSLQLDLKQYVILTSTTFWVEMRIIAPKLWSGNYKLACFVNNQGDEGPKWTVLSKIACTDKVLSLPLDLKQYLVLTSTTIWIKMHVITPKLWFGNSKLTCFVNKQGEEEHKWAAYSKIEYPGQVFVLLFKVFPWLKQ